ncbi:Phage/plasmid replication protein [Catenovulum agarivorans DS-2]|uniref:Phage/plasmid replication protein n=2 Tax=Catenovulum agarivorans TaxID=1172192 RepID=W7QGP6_9ALTE|nr:Phage/plasmid replication protein [Catenovulum agarivorans DS-2]
MTGNPSRFNRIDNLFGYASLDECFAVYNSILAQIGLPPFTKATRIYYRQTPDSGRAEQVSDGAQITRLDLTTNLSVGKNNTMDYIKGLSTLRYRNMIGNLYANGMTADWQSPKGNNRLIYPCAYDKANELELHSLSKVKKKYGEDSEQYKYLVGIINYCREQGVVRLEQKVRSEQLRRMGARSWGLFEEALIRKLHDDFLNLDKRLQVNSMDIQTISEQLISEDIVTNTKAATTTAYYVYEWMNGKKFDFSKSQVKTHRARLRKIGIDIKNVCDHSKFSPVVVSNIREIKPTPLLVPAWYQRPKSQLIKLAV